MRWQGPWLSQFFNASKNTSIRKAALIEFKAAFFHSLKNRKHLLLVGK
ncbi:hypothetical protein ACFFJF_00740 [Allobacillus sp. GCM10007489]|nr:hypothetical protein [Allobacillus sp. SKP2-8]